MTGNSSILSDLPATAGVARSTRREGVDVSLNAPTPAQPAIASPEWAVAGWIIRFVRLMAGHRLAIPQEPGDVFLKVVAGALTDRGAFARPREIRDTLLLSEEVTAGHDGALVAVMTRGDGAPERVEVMSELTLHGPLEDAFRWQRFDEKFGHVTHAFDGVEAYMSPGFHLLEEDGDEVCYVNLWTSGKGVDLTTHNHANDPSPAAPAFAETHWVFYNGSGRGGMYDCDEPGAPRTRYPMQTGQEHGPFFAVDEHGAPRRRENGAVAYPWHGWESGEDDRAEQAFDFVAAFETNPDYVKI
jgi:hypothetical protein